MSYEKLPGMLVAIYRPFVFTALMLLTPGAAAACERCFGAGSNSPVVTAIGLSMLTLVVITGVVLTGVTKFFRDMAVRAKKLEDAGYTEGVSEN